MISFMFSDDTRIENLKSGYLQYDNDDEFLVLRDDKTPIFLVRIENDKLKFYELDSITKFERTTINNIYLKHIMSKCDKIKSFIFLTGLLDMIDYSQILDITKFKDGELLVA